MKTKLVCNFCKKEYYVSPYRKDNSFYCSNSCRSSDKTGESAGRWGGGKVECSCSYCKKVYYLHKSQAKESLYCSASCRSKATRLYGDKSNFWKGGTVEYKCSNCGIVFSGKQAASRKYCSKSCFDISRMKRTTLICKKCGKEFTERNSKSEHLFCSLKCLWGYRVGEFSNTWKGGVSFEPYPTTFNEPFKRMIRERDNYTCAICKKYGNIVHHINYIKDDTVPENCITVCRSCHGKTNSNREYWIEYFRLFRA